MIEQKSAIFCAHMVDICRPGQYLCVQYVEVKKSDNLQIHTLLLGLITQPVYAWL